VRDRRQGSQQLTHEQLRDSRRQVYVTYLKCGDLLTDQVRAIYALTDRADLKAEDYERYSQTWNELIEGRSALDIAGPPAVADAAQSLFRAWADLCNQVDPWVNGKRWTTQDDKTYAENLQNRAECRKQFLSVVQSVLA
jgi:hypothetical protein